MVRDGRVVLVRHWHAQGVWTLPGGGIKKGELPEDAARREVLEETGYKVGTLHGVLGVYTGRPGKRRDDAVVYYTEDFTGGLKFLPNKEIMERGLFDFNHLPTTLSPANRRRIEAFINGVRDERGEW